MTGRPPTVGALTKKHDRLLETPNPPSIDAVRGPIPDAAGGANGNRLFPSPKNWQELGFAGNKRLSEKGVERLERIALVEECFIGGKPSLELRNCNNPPYRQPKRRLGLFAQFPDCIREYGRGFLRQVMADTLQDTTDVESDELSGIPVL